VISAATINAVCLTFSDAIASRILWNITQAALCCTSRSRASCTPEGFFPPRGFFSLTRNQRVGSGIKGRAYAGVGTFFDEFANKSCAVFINADAESFGICHMRVLLLCVSYYLLHNTTKVFLNKLTLL